MMRAVVAVDPTGSSSMVPLLEYTDSTMTYRRRYFARPELPTTLDLLLLNRRIPRSLAFQFDAIGEHLPHCPARAMHRPEQDHFDELTSTSSRPRGAPANAKAAFASSARAHRDRPELRELSDLLTERFFSHVRRAAS